MNSENNNNNLEQPNMRDFIRQKREIFLAQLAIDTKREELQRLDQLEKNEEKGENQNEQDYKDVVPKQDYEDLDDRYKRVLAEFENFKKRSTKERDSLYNTILSDVIEIILPVLDNLENAVKIETADEEYKKGIELVLKQFKDVLVSKGIEEIKTMRRNF